MLILGHSHHSNFHFFVQLLGCGWTDCSTVVSTVQEYTNTSRGNHAEMGSRHQPLEIIPALGLGP